MCHEARNIGSALGHLMHYLVNNPSVWPKLPKYNRTSKQSHEDRVRTLVSGIMQHAATVNKMPGDPPVVPPFSSSSVVMVTPRPTDEVRRPGACKCKGMLRNLWTRVRLPVSRV